MLRTLLAKRNHGIIGGTLVLAVTQLFASIAGLIRDRMLASTFPGLGVVDAYIAAFRPSDVLFQTCVVSAMGTVLVPALAKYVVRRDNDEASKVLGATVGMTALIFGGLACILALFFPLIVPFMGIRFTGETLTLYIQFGRLALLSNFLFVFGTAYGQYLVAAEKYWIYGITPILYTTGTIVGTVYLTPWIGPYGPMAGTVSGAVVYVALRMIGVHRAHCRIQLFLWHEDLKEMVRLMMPRVVALGAFQLQLLYITNLASALPSGSVTIDSYARNFASVLIGVVGIAVSQSIYSRMSQSASQERYDAFLRYYVFGISLGTILTIAGAVALVLLSPIAAWLVGLRAQLPIFSVCLLLYAISVPFESATHIQYRAFYSLKQTMLPAIVGVLGGCIAIGVAAIFLPEYGIYALALGYTAGEVVQSVGLAITLPIYIDRRKKILAATSSSPA